MTITGWGKITNNNRESLKAYLDYSVATRTLRKVEIPIIQPGTPAGRKCKTNDTNIQFCAGGIKGKHYLQAAISGKMCIKNTYMIQSVPI